MSSSSVISTSTAANSPPVIENRMSSLFTKRQLSTSGGNVRNVLKRCPTRGSPLADTTNINLLQQSDSSSNGIEPDQHVSSLITSARQWDLEVLNASFLASDVDKILQIPLPIFPTEDTLIWHFETNGAYTVKTVKRRRTQVEGYDVGLMEEQPMNGDYGQFGPGSVGLSVKDCWETNNNMGISNSLKLCASTLLQWGKEIIGNFKVELKNIKGKHFGSKEPDNFGSKEEIKT
ncbi:hypothetical protein F8388_005459 [Cannabis sativa]|uniref:Uncharacterized protein n=1 Tax=Cannabis sativa TaxID=3483 RepID=A0A7J6DWC9_CANSA|nr:hypothetical protein F8388_005459 [Cannabis sativa]